MSIKLAIVKAWAALHWERAAPVIAPAFFAIVLYCTLALFGAFEYWGDPWRAMIAISLIALGTALTVHALQGYKPPVLTDAQRRVEDDTGLSDREFEALKDEPVIGDTTLWQAHRARVMKRLATARAFRPRAAWARLDGYGLRISGIICILAGTFMAGNLAGPRLSEAFSFQYLDGGGRQLTAELWVEPPDYTGRPTLYLRDRRQANIPEGSTLAARLTGVSQPPRVSGGTAEIEEIGDRVWQIRVPVEKTGIIHFRGSGVRESVSLTVLYDELPRLELVSDPEADADGTLSIDFKAEDDYGVERFAFHARPVDEPNADWQVIDISRGQVFSLSETDTFRASETLARHPLSGRRVMFRVAGTDGAGQTGRSEPIEIVLPSRVFLDVLAQAVVEERRKFISSDASYAPAPDTPYEPVVINRVQYLDDQPALRFERAPAQVQRLGHALNALTDAPHFFFEDWVVYMGLETAKHEVRRARELEDLNHLEEDLWQIALRAELGSLADAERALRAAERALMEAMARGADALELGPLFDAFERAMDNYMAALAREATPSESAGGNGGQSMDGDMIQQLLQALQEAAELGDTEDARQAMAALMELLRNLQFSAGGAGGNQMSELSQALQEALEELSEIIGEQRDIMGETFEETDRVPEEDPLANPFGPPSAADIFGNRRDEDGTGTPDQETLNELADRQARLLDRLNELMENGVGGQDSEEELGEAGSAMDQADDALGIGNPDAALSAQDQALQALRNAAGAMGQRMLEEMDQGEGQGEGNPQTDPLGRALGGGPGDVELPSESERQRAREILEELRRRAGELGRSREELEYIDRLLERF